MNERKKITTKKSIQLQYQSLENKNNEFVIIKWP